MAFSKDWARGVDSSSSFPWLGREDQKKPFHSGSSKIYGKILVKSLEQFKAESKGINLCGSSNTWFNYLSVVPFVFYNYYQQP